MSQEIKIPPVAVDFFLFLHISKKNKLPLQKLKAESPKTVCSFGVTTMRMRMAVSRTRMRITVPRIRMRTTGRV